MLIFGKKNKIKRSSLFIVKSVLKHYIAKINICGNSNRIYILKNILLTFKLLVRRAYYTSHPPESEEQKDQKKTDNKKY